MAETGELVQKFMERDMHLTPKAVEKMQKSSKSDIEEIISDLKEREDRPSIVNDKVIDQILNSEEAIPSSTTKRPSEKSETKETEQCQKSGEESKKKQTKSRSVTTGDETVDEAEPEFSDSEEIEESEIDSDIEIIRDITGKSTSEGKVEDYVQLFRNRYEKLNDIVRAREGFQDYTDMENIPRHEGDTVGLVGLVRDKRETRKKDAWLIELEDPTGEAVIYIKDSERNEEVIEKVERVITDEVIGVRAKVPNDLDNGNRSPLVWGNEIVWPEIPHTRSSNTNENSENNPSGYAVLISDLHVGSEMFLSDVFEKFLDWLNGNAGNKKQKEIAEKVKYLIIAGDLVDGIGVYPGQQKELEIENIKKQYEKAANLLCRVPDSIDIIAAPGNHDAVRLAEPQPALDSEAAAPLRRADIKFVGNPAYISIEGVKFLIYHGMGYDDLISADSELDRDDVARAMQETLTRRHLAPIYGKPMGGKTPIAPEDEDYLVIDEIPDVMHCGHLHKYGCKEYRGVLMVNSATFQAQTLFMKRQGIDPTPGRVPIVDLETQDVKAINFA